MFTRRPLVGEVVPTRRRAHLRMRAGISLMGARLQRMGAGISLIGARIHRMGTGISLIGARIQRMGAGISLMGARLQRMGAGISLVGACLSLIGPRMPRMGARIPEMEARIFFVGPRFCFIRAPFRFMGRPVPHVRARAPLENACDCEWDSGDPPHVRENSSRSSGANRISARPALSSFRRARMDARTGRGDLTEEVSSTLWTYRGQTANLRAHDDPAEPASTPTAEGTTDEAARGLAGQPPAGDRYAARGRTQRG
jgi:hypothetical protein